MPIQNLNSNFLAHKQKIAILAIFLFFTSALFLFVNYKISPQDQVAKPLKQEEVLQVTPQAVSSVTLSLVSDKTPLYAGDTANISLKTVSVPASYKFLGFIASIKVPKDFEKPVLGANTVAFPGVTYDFPFSQVVEKTDYWEVQVLGANSKTNPLSLTNNTVLLTFPVKVASTAIKASNISFVKITASDIPSVISADETLANLSTNDLSVSLNPTVTPTLTLNTESKVYGSAPFDMVYTTNNIVGAKTFTSSNTPVATITNAGRVTITGVGSTTITFAVGASQGFSAGNKTAVVTVTQKALTITGMSVSKVYDKALTAPVTGTPTLVGVVTGDSVGVSSTGVSYAFSNVTVGSNKSLTRTGNYVLTGTSASKYTLTQPTLTGTITAKSVIGGFTASNKIYDGNTSATVLTRTLSGVLTGDSITLTGGTATFDNANVGTGKTVTLTGATLTGTGAGNYSLSSVSTTIANITPANQAPTDISLIPSSFDETAVVGTTVGTLSTIDSNTKDTFTYTVTGGDTSAFEIVGNLVKTKIAFDFEIKNSYSLKIRSTDNGGLFYEKTFTITVNDILVKGDLSKDDQVLVNDASMLVSLVFAGNATADQIARGDMNSDGKLDVRDAFLIVELIFK